MQLPIITSARSASQSVRPLDHPPSPTFSPPPPPQPPPNQVVAVPAIPLTMTAGAIFGQSVGVLIVLFSATLAATVSFLIARYLARDKVRGCGGVEAGGLRWLATRCWIGSSSCCSFLQPF